jgi:hypothetical protein
MTSWCGSVAETPVQNRVVFAKFVNLEAHLRGKRPGSQMIDRAELFESGQTAKPPLGDSLRAMIRLVLIAGNEIYPAFSRISSDDHRRAFGRITGRAE